MSDTLPEHAGATPSIPDFLRPLRSVVLAVVDFHGTLLDANHGFRELVAGEGGPPSPAQVRGAFLNPTFDELAAWARAADDAPAYSGLMTLGAVDAESDSWLGSVSARHGCLLIVCERDVDQDRRVQRQLLELTEEYAEQERELARAHRRLAAHADEVEQLSLTDALTQLPNRRHFDAIMAHELESAVRGETPLAVLLLDLDRFKAINDTHGHPQGDVLLQQVAATLSANVRAADAIARWGGEEFAVLAAGTDLAGATELAERLRRAVEQMTPPDGLPGVTLSAGVAEWRAGESAAGLVGRADEALYRAKDEGRDRVVVAGVAD